MYIIIKVTGILLVVLSTALSQLFMNLTLQNLSCDEDYEISYGCGEFLAKLALYFAILNVPLLLFLIVYSDVFISKLFPDEAIPWAAWNERSRLLRNFYKTIQLISVTYIPTQYQVFVNFFVLYNAF